jgi:hypothetical protein
MSIPGNDLLTEIERDNPKLGQYLRRYVFPSVQKVAQNAAVSAQSQLGPPAPPESVSVKTAGELMQVVVNHSAKLQKGVHYVYSIATNPQMSGAQIEVKPASRAPVHFSLPTKDGGGATHNYYVAVQAQYPGSPASRPTYFGGSVPVAVNMAGTTQMDILPGTGSGTAQNGGEVLVGIGKSQVRLSQGPKRNV